MGGIEDYIKWRGDLTFEQSAFNEVDNLGYLNTGVVNSKLRWEKSHKIGRAHV